jgi:hypothetical protein
MLVRALAESWKAFRASFAREGRLTIGLQAANFCQPAPHGGKPQAEYRLKTAEAT